MTGMSTTLQFQVVRAKQSIGEFLLGSVNAYRLLEICKFDFRRIQDRGGYKDFLGIQRKLDDKRVSKIAAYLQTLDATFPSSIIISVDARSAKISETSTGIMLTLESYEDPAHPDLKIEYNDIATIIDGQHRLKAFERVPSLDFDLNVAVFVDIDDAREAEIFSIVNKEQTKVKSSLVYDLFSVAKSRSPEKSSHEITVALDKIPSSPFFQKIKRLGSSTEGRYGELLTQANVVRGILPYITNDPLKDRDTGKRVGFWDPLPSDDLAKRIFFEFFRLNQDERILANIINFFSAVKDRWPDAWNATGEGHILPRTTGFNGLIRFLRPAYLEFTTVPAVVTKAQYLALLNRCTLQVSDFTRDNYLPGSSGAAKLYNDLITQTGVRGR
jgi:DGQHR domain-containing protein